MYIQEREKNDEAVTQKTSTMLISQALVIFYDATYEEKRGTLDYFRKTNAKYASKYVQTFQATISFFGCACVCVGICMCGCACVH